MNYSTPGFPVHHQLPEFAQTHIHWVVNAIQPSHRHPLLLLPLASASFEWKLLSRVHSLQPCRLYTHQARRLEWVAFPFSRGSSQPRDQTQVSRIAGGFFTSWAIREVELFPSLSLNPIFSHLWMYSGARKILAGTVLMRKVSSSAYPFSV